jgi:hypothetical protein
MASTSLTMPPIYRHRTTSFLHYAPRENFRKCARDPSRAKYASVRIAISAGLPTNGSLVNIRKSPVWRMMRVSRGGASSRPLSKTFHGIVFALVCNSAATKQTSSVKTVESANL